MKKKRGVKPTRAVKELLSSKGLRAENWLVLSKSQDCIKLFHRITGSLKTLSLN